MITACSIEGCPHPKRARGWCNTHYLRWYRRGTPEVAPLRYLGDPYAAFTARTEWRAGHLVWTAPLDSTGYGVIWDGARQVRAHRWAWTTSHGSIPEGLYVDHACHNRACVNIDHLRLATPEQNSRNRSGASRLSGTGVRGVTRDGSRFRARIGFNGKDYNLGSYATLDEAEAAVTAKRSEVFGEYAGLSRVAA